MKVLLTLVFLMLCGLPLRAQGPAAGQAYTDARLGYRLTYPLTWQVSQEAGAVTFYAGGSPDNPPAAAVLRSRSLPDALKTPNPLAQGLQDSLWSRIRALPQSQVLRLTERDAGAYQELSYDYSYATAAGRTRVLGRRLLRGGQQLQLEYRAPAADRRYLAEGQQLVESLALTGGSSPAAPPKRYAEQGCDDKMYGIAALRVHNGIWEDDCRTIHEFNTNDLAAAPRVHRQVLPFQSYALAKGFDNCLYAVTKAPTNAPEYVYRYDPASRQGGYTEWQLPAQGGESVWISAATDAAGRLYFITSDGNQLVRVSPADGSVTVVWSHDPVQQAPYYPAIGFAGAGTHANFCLDDKGTLYEVYSTDGAVLRVDLRTLKADPDLLPIDGLPERGGYSDLLMQQDASGQRRLYLAGPKSIYEVDLSFRDARRVRRGVYTDLAGCNLFRSPVPPPAAPAPAAAPSSATWRGRVLDAVTRQPLPRARLSLRGRPVPLTADGTFSFSAQPGFSYAAEAQLAGYLAADSLYTLPAGPSVQDILLRPLGVGTVTALDKVQFEQGQATLLASSFAALDQLVTLLSQNPGMSIELRGHTDNVGDPQKNVALSEQRVAAVKTYLVNHGVAAERISGVGLGGAEPRASNEREETRKLNRRVEFRVTGVQ
ncbi:OmpA family protein [Hymenobacter sp. 15J16-1T3B]|uniref:OmpA family protein n=1 Tax=Hymenobacter sp. 15J16-1T3B TaxID=2886941 RepID=UPI001D12801F|nr:OmpA family protein [Hymenobacter sp. 15J16-1T3B]MCC3160318.1 OmpA family protein [Hymenobacter sp. 15J16-1T3B]